MRENARGFWAVSVLAFVGLFNSPHAAEATPLPWLKERLAHESTRLTPGLPEMVPSREERISALADGLLLLLAEHEANPLRIVRLPLTDSSSFEGDLDRLAKAFEAWMQTYVQNYDFSGTPEADALWIDVMRRIGVEERRRIVLGVVGQGSEIGEFLTALAIAPSPLFGLSYFTDAEIADAVASVPPVPTGVRWDGEAQRLVFEDSDLRLAVASLAGLFAVDLERARALFASFPEDVKGRFRRNSDGSVSASKTEPFDLLRGVLADGQRALTIVKGTTSGETGSRAEFGKIFHRALFKALDMGANDDPVGASLPDRIGRRGLGDESVSLLCATPAASVGTRKAIFGRAHIELSELLAASGNSKSVPCGSETLTITAVPKDGRKMRRPRSIDFSRERLSEKLEVVVNFALTDEVDGVLLRAVEAFLAAEGYRRKGPGVDVETLPRLRTLLPTTDVVIPVAHLLDVNEFHVGTQWAREITFERVIRDQGRSVPLRVRILFPVKRQDSRAYEIFTREDLAATLRSRRRARTTPLVILNASCQSSGAVISWTNAHRDALALDLTAGDLDNMEDADDVPHVYASSKGFPTESPLAILGNFVHPLNALKLLAQGQSPETLFEMLSRPAPEGPLLKALRAIDAILPGEILEPRGSFDPVYNARYASLFENEGFLFRVSSAPGDVRDY